MFEFKHRLAQKIITILVFPYIFIMSFAGLMTLIIGLQNPAILLQAFVFISFTIYYIVSIKFMANVMSSTFSKLFLDLLKINMILSFIFNLFIFISTTFLIFKIFRGNTEFLNPIFDLNPDLKNKAHINIETFIQYLKWFLYIWFVLVVLFTIHIIISFINFYKYKNHVMDGN
ncbi:MAG: hypothetical protein QM539_01335 [Alphaproteobacteria bacterium]|nr:hypothetical protein [Alphaproteobacteria bacterium]